ncbi:hypothetical protein ACN2EN_05765 [Aliarcobacter lanthieri]|uniref:hypothetical protein n=1 Tax=Aliarcobacter lanthieri TaxID=1355374 RepID=UPI003AFAE4F0
MKYIIPLEKSRQLYHFDKSSDGNILKQRGITPILNNERKYINGTIYVESPFNYNSFLEITKFKDQSQEKWKEIIQELASKIGAKKIKTKLLLLKENSLKSGITKEKTTEIKGKSNFNGITSINSYSKSVDSNEQNIDNSNLSLEFELNLKGKSQPIEEIEKWIKDKNINLEDNLIFRVLLEQFKNDNLCNFKETKKIEQLLTGIKDVNSIIIAASEVDTPLFNSSMKNTLTNINKEEFRNFEKMEFELEIIF